MKTMSSLPAPELRPSSNTCDLIREAIEKRQQVIATYHRYRREMCLHSLGVNRRRHNQARTK